MCVLLQVLMSVHRCCAATGTALPGRVWLSVTCNLWRQHAALYQLGHPRRTGPSARAPSCKALPMSDQRRQRPLPGGLRLTLAPPANPMQEPCCLPSCCSTSASAPSAAAPVAEPSDLLAAEIRSRTLPRQGGWRQTWWRLLWTSCWRRWTSRGWAVRRRAPCWPRLIQRLEEQRAPGQLAPTARGWPQRVCREWRQRPCCTGARTPAACCCTSARPG